MLNVQGESHILKQKKKAGIFLETDKFFKKMIHFTLHNWYILGLHYDNR